MGRNDLCFCGSGKKQKLCHNDFNEKSEVSEKLRLFAKFDMILIKNNLSTNIKSYCSPGCSACCFDYFTIQSIEFDIILYELSKWSKGDVNEILTKVESYWRIFEKEYPEAKELPENKADYYHIEEINSSIAKTTFPCIFLDTKLNLCKIYNVRPFKCRIFGNAYSTITQESVVYSCSQNVQDCSKEDVVDSFINIDDFLIENEKFNIVESKRTGITILNREYPLIYYMYQHFFKKDLGLNIVDYDMKFNLVSQLYREIYAQKAKDRAGIKGTSKGAEEGVAY
jgi:Fe-S-cluster containining protein